MNAANKSQLTPEDFQRAAQALGCELAAIRAVFHVEAAGKAFYADGRAPILFEAHIFDELTGGRFRGSHPQLSRARWTRGLYKGGLAEYGRLNQAMKLDRRAALMSASWGAPQILGRNYRMCGFADVESFVAALQSSAAAQLQAFTRYVKSARLDDELRRRDWRGFAKGYNGPAFDKHDYDGRLAAAYRRFANRPEQTVEAVHDDDAARQIVDARRYEQPPAAPPSNWPLNMPSFEASALPPAPKPASARAKPWLAGGGLLALLSSIFEQLRAWWAASDGRVLGLWAGVVLLAVAAGLWLWEKRQQSKR